MKRRCPFYQGVCGINESYICYQGENPYSCEFFNEYWEAKERMEEEKGRTFCGYTWEDLHRVLCVISEVEDKVKLTKKEFDDYDIAVQCVTEIMNRMKDGKPIGWDE